MQPKNILTIRHELLNRVMNCELQCHSKQELWHAYLSYIKPLDVCLEFGVATGRSINCMAAMRPRTKFHGFDSFNGLPENWGRVEKGRFKCNHKKIKFHPNVELHIGLFDDTLPTFIGDASLDALRGVHIDCDLGSSTRTVLSLLSDKIIEKKPMLLFDEFYNYSGFEDHEFGAFSEWLEKTDCQYRVVGRDVLHKQVLVELL